MGYAGNLTYPDSVILINDLTAKDLGVYTRSEDSAPVLWFKKHAVGIPYISGKSAIRKSAYTPGKYKGVLLELDNTCPCEECGFEYGIDIRKKVKQPGVYNSVYPDEGRFYGGRLDKVQACTNGLMADSDVLLMEDTILDGITSDTGLGNEDPSIVNVYRAYRLVCSQADLSGDAVTFTYTSPAGVDTALTLDQTTLEANIAVINDDATVGAAVRAIATSSTDILVIGITAGAKFTFAHSGSALVTDLDRYIYIESKDVNVQYEVTFEDGFATAYPIHLFRITTSTITTSELQVSWSGGSGWTTATSATGVAALITELNGTDLSGEAIIASSQSGDDSDWIHIFAWGSDLDVVDIKISRSSTLAIAHRVGAEGRYPRMTSDDVFRQFAAAKGHGKLTSYRYLDQPVEDAEYWLLEFEYDQDTADLHGASHGNNYKQKLYLYIRDNAANFETDIFKSTDRMADAPASPDEYLGDLLDAWNAGTSTSLELPTS